MRPKKKSFSLREKLDLLMGAGLHIDSPPPLEDDDQLLSLEERIKRMLGIMNDGPLKATEMTYMIMYDITSNKVRNQLAKYLIRQGCIRIQKSVFIAKTENTRFQEIHDTLRDINSYYANHDSIILAPINASDVRSMKLIGKNVQLNTLLDKPNTLFF